MNYEDAFRHYREGTATEEEKEFVLEEIAKAKALSNFLEDEGLNVKSAPIKEADKKEVREAKRGLWVRRAVAGLVSIAVLLLILGAVLGGVFGAAASYASEGVTVSKAEAAAIATEFAYNDAVLRGFTGNDNFMSESTGEIDHRFNIVDDLKSSYYTYEIDVKGYSADGFEYEYEIGVNSRTGSCWVIEFERDRD